MSETYSVNWANESTRWHAYFRQNITQQIDNLLKLINKENRKTASLERHFDSIYTLFTQGLHHPTSATRLKLIALVRALHPFPTWWGKWSEWMHVLSETAFISQQENQVEALLWAKLQQITMLEPIGDAERALILAEEILQTAREHNKYEAIFRAEMAIFNARNYLGMIGYQMVALEALEKSLLEISKKLSPTQASTLEIEFLLIKIDIIRRQGATEKAGELVSRAYHLAEQIFPPNALAMTKILLERSSVFWSNREYDAAIADRQKAIELFNHWGDRMSTIEAMGGIGLIHWTAERHKASEETLRTSLAIAEEYKIFTWQTVQIGDLALSFLSRGQLQQAMKFLQRHKELSELTNNYAEDKRAMGNMGTAQTHLGDFEAALHNLQNDHQLIQERRLNVANSRLYAKTAWVYDGLGQMEKAIEYAEASLAIAEEIGDPLSKIIALRCLSELDLPIPKRIHHAEEGLSLAREHKRKLNQAGALFTLAEIHNNDNLRNEAIQILEELDATTWLENPLVFRTLRLPLLI